VQRGELKEAKRRISAKRRSRRPYGMRKPGDYMAQSGGSGAGRYLGCSVFSLAYVEYVVNEY